MPIAPDFKELLPAHPKPDDRPFEFLWVYDPVNGAVHIAHNRDRHPAWHVTHNDIAPSVHHPDRVRGYAYAIQGGWRIMDEDANEVKDKFVVERVMRALRGEVPEVPKVHKPQHASALVGYIDKGTK